MTLLELTQKHIRERDLMMLVDKPVTLLIKGHANDSQTETLFNYLVQLGSTLHFEMLTREIALRVPQHKERLITIIECLCGSRRRARLLEGKPKGKRKGEKGEALRIAHTMFKKGIDCRLMLIVAGLAIDELTVSSD